jgi:serine/threonine protein kinase
MTPEQASGHHDRLDQRSDIFSLSLLFYELMTLRHPLADKKTVQEVLAALISGEVNAHSLKGAFMRAQAPCEYGDFLKRGLAQDPEQRYSSVAQMIDGMHRIRSGKCAVTCHVTFAKRLCGETQSFVTRYPRVFTLLMLGSLLLAAFGVWSLVASALHH